ncbi:wyosine [tRNA(Phe)-imidazoG37] synthetase (radical SAM superfamily) [Dysgonomonas sp. PFB1-18]|uniref:radical SAM protein n=1 Tax=unclassified Dysgonomonas TaxID=2630389 RepID=UPI002476A4A3|nr:MULTISPECIES: radical SAM protein [unclassified Dysgonomonas]MDH6310382.1 wyosine [tRNA(Phe)-imidazoG37] synthetase (radical SAM superfamily) [Dysgonomonas sp. PF1-14]MDH6340288.1 wyosine [tRNA(Phe)-imidazoG37] synthetase (radical SAM superfamily) [Dysgonomonas sp. PF1-16]MDH6381932.1 wyosine [tRNA(Phe)-imidazoG37] synthetase (radical SAM superfamily) [Dysgonomonas sp. PFB1-18]MDH6399259.1 wyosine [tRNA(Phe)-imidazoG37] synthetase (radical SAM superfamily) [Dysgonomonas sp. PF1-23]
MSTILFHEIVFGPIHSRRLGSSLGMNLLPYDGKLCSFDCIYCECGYNEDFRTKTRLPDRENVRAALEDKLIQLQKEGTPIDVITFAGNGEPTVHPQFAEIIDDTIVLRDKYYPNAKISVLSNAMHAGKQKVFDALTKVDNNILKLDSAIPDTVRLIDRPNSPEYSIEKQIELFKRFNGNFIMQTMFLKGSHKGKIVDNTTEEEISAWLEAVKAANPREVMIYSIDRETPEKNLEKVPVEKLKEIGRRVEALGIKASVAG